jgi:hypothetical protein
MEWDEGSDWDWIRAGEVDFGGDLIFARDVTPDNVIEALGMDPSDAQMLPASRVDEVLLYPFYDELYGIYYPCIRVGQVGEWAFAYAATSMNPLEAKSAARELSRAGSAALLAWTLKVDSFHSVEGGAEVTWFDPPRSYDRAGSDPDRFVRQMMQVGLDIAPPAAHEPFPNPRIAVLEMLTLALGIRVPREMAEGPLLTFQLVPAAS